VSPGVVGTGRESGYQGSRFWDDVGKPHMSKQEVDSLPVCHAHFRRHVAVRDLTRVLQ